LENKRDHLVNFFVHVKVVKFRDQARCVKLNALDKNAFQQRQSNCDCRGNMNNEACQCAPISSIRNSTEFVSLLRAGLNVVSNTRKMKCSLYIDI